MLDRVKRAYLRRKLGPSIVVVSGLPRSGTSMMMNMLGSAGLPIVTDREREADEDNPKGYFEDERVKQLDRSEDKSWLAECKGRVIKIISFLLLDLPDEYHYRVIFMQRDLNEVIASQNKMMVRRGEDPQATSDEKMLANYRFHLKKVDYVLEEQPNFDVLRVGYRDALDDAVGQAERVSRFLGRSLDTAAMAATVDARLYRNRR